MNLELPEKLHAAVTLADDLKAFRSMLVAYGTGYERVTGWVEESISRVSAQLNNGRWPPVWWRYARIDSEAQQLSHHFHRADAEGFFYGDEQSGRRAEILQEVDAISKRYEAARRNSAQQRIQPDGPASGGSAG